MGVAGCNKSEVDSGSGSPPAVRVGKGHEALAAEIPADWSLERALPVVLSDKGEKIVYTCLIYSETHMGSMRDVAVNIPQLGIRKVDADEVQVLASSEKIANAILSSAFVGPRDLTRADPETLIVKGCRPVIASSGAKASDRPLSEHATIDDALQVAYRYYAAKGGAVPHEEIAKEFFADYRSESDAFVKRDLLTELATRFDSEVAKASKNPYVRINVGGEIGPYDFKNGKYSLESVVGPNLYLRVPHTDTGKDGSSTSGSTRYSVRFRAEPDFLSYKPASEEAARQMESALAPNFRKVTSVVFGKVIRADEINGNPYILVDVTRIEVRKYDAAATDEPLFVK